MTKPISSMAAMLVSIAAIVESAQAKPAWAPLEKRAEAEESKAAESKAAASKASDAKEPKASATKSATEHKETAKTKASDAHKKEAAASTTTTTKKATASNSSSSSDSGKKKEASSSSAAAAAAAKPSNHFSFNGVSPVGPTQNEAPTTAPTTNLADQSNQNSQQSSGMSGGAIAGIIIAILGVAAIAGFFLVRRRRKQAERNRMRMKPDPFTMGFGSHDPPGSGGLNQQNNSYPPHTAYNMANQSPMIQLPPIGASAQPSPMMAPAMTGNTAIDQYNAQVNNHYSSAGNAITASGSEYAVPAAAAIAGGAAAIASTSSPQPVVPAEAPTNSNNNSLGVFSVISTYTPTLSDELDIQPGDRVEVIVEYDDGWCQGINLSRGNCKGVFPAHCVDMFADMNGQGTAATSPVPGSDQSNYASSMKRVSSMLGNKQQHSSPYYL
ncbi:hypothetical protein BDB00DRAFT_500770 [Zychaea mexicana]|uniref:uncharacterized protein n=1 Tax=Zychaea mexicana TaxID=64656 RepID=UPI0022FE44F4|nr:uncharacterized protein BDB00DRAFT_500770 [Zychaea mexicana]KAI9498148.1 hypothetical protein BDB00DRAFT_500770 [Zychaea mexicana]